MGSPWRITVHFHDKEHRLVSEMTFPETEYEGTETLRDVVYPELLGRIRELRWRGYGLWAGHEPLYEHTTLDEVNYQRSGDGRIQLDCEDHNCKSRSIRVPLIRHEECLICCDGLTDANRTYPLCFHSCVCVTCYGTLERCPLCRKPVRHGQSQIQMIQ